MSLIYTGLLPEWSYVGEDGGSHRPSRIGRTRTNEARWVNNAIFFSEIEPLLIARFVPISFRYTMQELTALLFLIVMFFVCRKNYIMMCDHYVRCVACTVIYKQVDLAVMI